MGDTSRVKPLFDFNSILKAAKTGAAAVKAGAAAVSGGSNPHQTSTGYAGPAASQGYSPPSSSYSSAEPSYSYSQEPSQPVWQDPGIVGNQGLGGSNGSNGGSSGSSSGSGGGGTPATTPPPVVKPAPPVVPPKPNYGEMASPYVDKWGNSLSNADTGTDAYAAAARQINNRLGHTTDANREGLTTAYAAALQRAGNTLAARDLYRTGGISTDITPVDPATQAPAMETIIIPDAKSDSLYKRQSTDLAQQLADFQGDQQLANSQYDNQYADVLRKMGWGGKGWNQDRSSGAYGEATNDNLDDFVGRGLGYSGLLAQGQSQIDQKFNEQKNDVDRQATDFDNTQARALGTFRNKNSQSISQALQDAISRITQQYGVDRSQVKVGSNNSITREKSS